MPRLSPIASSNTYSTLISTWGQAEFLFPESYLRSGSLLFRLGEFSLSNLHFAFPAHTITPAQSVEAIHCFHPQRRVPRDERQSGT